MTKKWQEGCLMDISYDPTKGCIARKEVGGDNQQERGFRKIGREREQEFVFTFDSYIVPRELIFLNEIVLIFHFLSFNCLFNLPIVDFFYHFLEINCVDQELQHCSFKFVFLTPTYANCSFLIVLFKKTKENILLLFSLILLLQCNKFILCVRF